MCKHCENIFETRLLEHLKKRNLDADSREIIKAHFMSPDPAKRELLYAELNQLGVDFLLKCNGEQLYILAQRLK